jgi:fermentation-respiration switch protein FrsA (DUF1100 family)
MLEALWVLVVAIVLVLAVIWLFQRRLIYFPLNEPVPPAASVLPTAEEISFQTEDGLPLRGWFVPALGAIRFTVLVFNGNAGDRSYRAPLAAGLARKGLSVLLFDYRGYGGNPGNPSERGLVSDARAARAYLESRPDVDSDKIAYFGESLGAAVAVTLAVERAPAALILRSPFTSLSDMGRLHYPFLPTGPLLRDRFDSVGRIGRVAYPVLIVAGERDQIVPLGQSRRLYDAISTTGRLVVVPGADHNDYELLAGEQLIAEIARLLDTVATGDPPTS